MTREELIAAMNECATELGQAPNVTQFRRLSKISLNQIRKNFGNYTRLLSASGVERHGAGYTASLQSLFLDWARVARTTGKIPTIAEYELEGKFSVRPLVRRFRTWSQVPAGLLEYAGQEGMERRMGRCAEDHCGPFGRGGKTYADIRIPYDHALPAQGADGGDYLWKAHACPAELRPNERKRSDFCVWKRGGRAGLFDHTDSNGISRLRSVARSGPEPVDSGED
jgi:Homing endonuclease associated repeat